MKGFNDQMEGVNAASEQQVKNLNASLKSSQHQHQTILSKEEGLCDELSGKLINMEDQLTKLRAKADDVQVQANGLVAHHVEDLTIDLNQ